MHYFKISLTFKILTLLLFLAARQVDAQDHKNIEIPKSLDDRLTVELFAAEPDIVTVTGLTVDPKGRVLVVESQTHFRPDDYDGPETDRIRLFEDTNGDGKADRVETFYEGTTYTMNVAAHPFNGWVYVATRSSIFRIKDVDDDGIADREQRIATLETESDYPHNGLSGFAFDFAGNVFFSFGENMGAPAILTGGPGKIYEISGSASNAKPALPVDAVQLPANQGAGGIFFCQSDGRNLKRFATGFWNPFHLCFDTYGRMFLGDNDPGNRPPCRFLSIVEGGDYGYRRYTLEPFIAVDGEVPGTLPMTSSTGESPTGIIAYESDHLPDEYRGDLLVATWGEHRIDRYRLIREGASFRTTSEAMIAGGENFRPSGIAVAPDGSLFVGDWADRSYPIHGKGRVWHIKAINPQANKTDKAASQGIHSADRIVRERAARKLIAQGKSGLSKLQKALRTDADPRVRSLALDALITAKAMTPELSKIATSDSFEAIREQAARTIPLSMIDLIKIASKDHSTAVQAAALRRMNQPKAEPLLLKNLASSDPFMQQAARKGLGQSATTSRLVELLDDGFPGVRLAVILLLRDSDHSQKLSPEIRNTLLEKTLKDRDPQVRFAVLQWIGRDHLKQFHKNVSEQLAVGATTPELFQAYLACLAQLDGVMELWTKGTAGDWWLSKADSYRYAAPLLKSPDASSKVVQQVLRFLPKGHKLLTLELLDPLLKSPELAIQTDAVTRLAELTTDTARKRLLDIATSPTRNKNVRAEAVIGLDSSRDNERAALINLTNDLHQAVRHEALRGLRGVSFNDAQKASLNEIAKTDQASADLVAKILSPGKLPGHPKSTELKKWIQLLQGPADKAAGERIFFHPKGPGCALCHRIDGKGTAIGPSFVRVNGQIALTRERLVESILQPSLEVDPGYMPLMIVTTDGKVASGIYHKHNGIIRQIYDSKGKILTFKVDDIEEMIPQTTSIMPDGLTKTMTTQEFRDLLAYLLNAK